MNPIYSLETILSLYNDHLPLPSGFIKQDVVYSEKPSNPFNYLKTRKTMEHPSNDSSSVKDNYGRVTKVTPISWYYLDPKNVIQGPFDSDKMAEWWHTNCFHKELRISTRNDMGSFKLITSFFPNEKIAFFYSPIDFSFLSVEPETDNPVCKMISNFEKGI